MKIILIVAALLLLIGVPAAFLLRSSTPEVKVDPPVKVIGIQTPVHVHVQNARGLRNVMLILEQDGKSYTTNIGEGLDKAPHELIVNTGKQVIPSLHDGKARLSVTASSNDFRAKSTTVAFDVDVITARPQVVADGVQHYINQGGSELVTFKPSGAWTEAGVQVGDHKFRSFPLPNHPGEYFSLFCVLMAVAA